MSASRRTKKSKRKALRLCCHKHPVTYKTAYDDGEGFLINISSGGCAFESATLALSVQEKVLVSIELDGKENIVEAKAVVVRVKENEIAVKFILIEPSSQSLIRSYFTKKLRTT